jgi:hypothetical protein
MLELPEFIFLLVILSTVMHEGIFVVQFPYLMDKIEVSSFGFGRKPARRTTISNAQYSKLNYVASQTTSMKKEGGKPHITFCPVVKTC